MLGNGSYILPGAFGRIVHHFAQHKNSTHMNTDKTTLKCDKEFGGKGAGARREKEKRGGEDGWLDDLIRCLDQMICLDDLIRWFD